MTGSFITLTEDQFDMQFTPVENHLNPQAGWLYNEGTGCLFETYGAELEFVRAQDPETVWTLVDGDDGDLYLLSGYHFVNRFAYLITREAVPEDTSIEVRIATSDPDRDPDASEESGEMESDPVSMTEPLPSGSAAALPGRFDGYQIHGMRRLPLLPGSREDARGNGADSCEPVPDSEAEFWSLFGHIPGRGVECVGDFPSREQAEEVYARITGEAYGR